ncbi:MAG: hypothetical protein ABL876_12725, partial [Chitinophagaceae bacterium]
LKREDFGVQITKDNGWLKEIIAPLRKEGESKMYLAKKIYTYVRDNFTCTNYNGVVMGQTLKTIVKTKSGSVSEINLLLTAMLNHENIESNPVILSTRANGFSYSMYPLISQYNYVVTQVIAEGKTLYLDATEPGLGFGYLPLRCYNGHARVINKTADAIEFNADAITETRHTSVFMINDDKGNILGSMNHVAGFYESLDLRDQIKVKGKEELQKEIKKDFGLDIVVSNFIIDSLEKLELPVAIKYDFDIKSEKEDIMYLNPMLGEGVKENPFKSAERYYPVERPFAVDETYMLQMEVPQGYVVDELPASIIVKLNEADEGVFEYRVSQSGVNISFRSRIRINRAYFLPEEYQMLREFFGLIVKKHAEQIVFKKKP